MPMKWKRANQIHLFLWLAFFLLAFFCRSSGYPAQTPETLLRQADACRKSLYGSSKRKKYRHNWTKCLRRYEKIYKSYPKTDSAVWARYHAGRMHTWLYTYSGKSGDLNEALRLFKGLTEDASTHRLADDAQYRIGEIYHTYRQDPTQAYVEFLKVEIKFPSGDMVPKAKEMLDKLAVTLSKNYEDRAGPPDNRAATKKAAVKDIRHWSTPTYTRVVVDLENPVTYHPHLLKADPHHKKPRRLYLDLENAFVPAEIDSTVTIKDGLLRTARAGQFKPDTVRVVLDMESIGGYNVFHLHDPFRIVVDVRRGGSPAKDKPKAMPERPVRKGIRKSEEPPSNMSLARQLGLNVRRIVIDPGHGGKDPGCNARGAVREKDIVLSMAKILARKIKANIKCEVYLTRTRDVFLPLERRTAIANMKKADLFISLHINAHKSRKIRGLETYFLNMATDEHSVVVAARENATSEKNISDLQKILNELMLNTKIYESSRLAHAVQQGMVSQLEKKYARVRSLGVKQAPFYVLVGAEMPSILIETGFLTNQMEKKRLLSKTYQEKLAVGITAGIRAYISSIDKVYKGG